MKNTIVGENKSGNALYESIIEAKIQRTREMGCFVAGTLVHTREGLKPIETIKVGDYVLSRHESGSGEQVYEEVVNTFVYEQKEVYRLAFGFMKEADNPAAGWDEDWLVVTGGHPVWVEEIHYSSWETGEKRVESIHGWRSVRELYLLLMRPGLEWETFIYTIYTTSSDGRRGRISPIMALLQTDKPDVAISASFPGFNAPGKNDPYGGNEYIFSDSGVKDGYYGYVNHIDPSQYSYEGYDTVDPLSTVKLSGGYLPYRTTVYNLEVRNTHTYYVSSLGLWVRSS